jgi:hypothetical protein
MRGYELQISIGDMKKPYLLKLSEEEAKEIMKELANEQ